jgi:hypothetical protein
MGTGIVDTHPWMAQFLHFMTDKNVCLRSAVLSALCATSRRSVEMNLNFSEREEQGSVG